MASGPSRRISRELPPDLSELMDKLIKYAYSFIRVFDNRESRMRQIVREFHKIAAEVKGMHGSTDTARTTGAVGGGIAIGLGILAAPFTGGASLLLAAGGAAAGGAVIVGTNITKTVIENGSAKKVENLGKEFMKIVQPMQDDLDEIKTTCEKLEQRSTEAQAGNTLSVMKEFQWLLRRVSELQKRSGEVLDITVVMMQVIGELVSLILKIFRITATPEEDEKLRDAIIQSADQCQKVLGAFNGMKEELKDFTGK